jgi:hypothetical protein
MQTVAAPTEAILRIAQTVCWWRPPDEVIAQPVQFAARVMALATWDDVLTVWRTLGDDIFRAALRDARPGVFDRRSWAFWHRVFGMEAPPMPRRPFITDEMRSMSPPGSMCRGTSDMVVTRRN